MVAAADEGASSATGAWAPTSPRMEELRAGLAAGGIESEVRRVPYEFQRGADRMLVCARR